MKQYAVYSDEIDKIQEHINDNILSDDQFDSIAPFTQNIEYQVENYDLSEDVGIPSVTTSTEPLILNELHDDDYRQLVQTLNKKQKEFFYHVLHLIKTSDKPFYYFLSGGAGVGKSHLVKALYQAALKY